jgi:hypothetical protein
MQLQTPKGCRGESCILGVGWGESALLRCHLLLPGQARPLDIWEIFL